MFNFELKPPIVLYARVSSDKQKERHSVEDQIYTIRNFAKNEGIEIAREYIDTGVNGDLPWSERPDANALLSDVRAGNVKTVLVFLYDRFSRDVYEGISASRELKRCGASPYSILEPFDINTPFGEYMFINSLNNAQLAKATMLERMRIGTNRKARQGAYLGGVVPYGYAIEKDSASTGRTFVLVPSTNIIPGSRAAVSESDVVRMIFDWLTDTASPRSCTWIAHELNRRGIPTRLASEGRIFQRHGKVSPNNGLWNTSSVVRILHNEVHKGVKKHGKRSIKDREIIASGCASLVTPEQWDAAQSAALRNRSLSARNAKRVYLLRGLIRCQLCGSSYIGMGHDLPDGTFKARYMCNGRHGFKMQSGIDPSLKCPSREVPADIIESIVVSRAVKILREPKLESARIQAAIDRDRIDSLKPSIVSSENDTAAAMREIVEAESDMRRIKNERLRVIELYRRQAINDDEFDEQKVILDKQEKQAEERQDTAKSILSQVERRAEFVRRNISEMDEVSERWTEQIALPESEISASDKRSMIEDVIEKIEVETIVKEGEDFRDRKVRLHFWYRFSGEKRFAEVSALD